MSVVIPAHRSAATLGQAIGSVLGQTHPPAEVLVVDDGSDDGGATLDAALRAADRASKTAPDVPVRGFSQPNRGACAARNAGFFEVDPRSEAVMFLDADDLLGPACLWNLAGALAAAPDAGFAVAPWFRLEQRGEAWHAAPPSCRPRGRGEDPLTAWLRGWYAPPCAVLWSRDALVSTLGWDESLAQNQDGDLAMRAMARGFAVAFVENPGPEAAAFYRRPAGGAATVSTGTPPVAALASRLRVLQKLEALLHETGRFVRFRDDLAHAAWLLRAAALEAEQPAAAAGAEALARRASGSRLRRRLRGLLRKRSAPRAAEGPPPPPGRIEHGAAFAAALSTGLPPRTRPAKLTAPEVSVVVPAFNRENTLPATIASVLDQTHGDLELIVVDDGSTDGTVATARAAAEQDPRVRVLVQPRNAGVASARDRGLAAARGRLLAFLDSDDHWLPDKLRLQVQAFHTDPGPALVTACGRNGLPLGLVLPACLDDLGGGQTVVRHPRPAADCYIDMRRRMVLHGAASGAVFTRPAAIAAGPHDTRLPAIEDWDWFLRLTRFCRTKAIAEVLVVYNDPPDPGRRSRHAGRNLDARRMLAGKLQRHHGDPAAARDVRLETVRRATLLAGAATRPRRRAMVTVLRHPLTVHAWRLLARAIPPRGESSP